MKPFKIGNIEINHPLILSPMVRRIILFAVCNYFPCYNLSIMGQITIEIPQKINRTYRLVSEDSAKKVLSSLDKMVKQENSVEDDEILGLWADRDESVKKIARELRQGWNRNEKNG